MLVVDKEKGWTSHDVVARCRRLFGQRRVGHAGTLDPGATGVLLVALGRATRLTRFVGALPKSYEAEVVLGVTTSTLDDEGGVVGRFDMAGVTLGQARQAAAALTGDTMQVPPMVSARKVGGERLHRLARKGVEVERTPHPVTVSRFDVDATGAPEILAIRVDCSSGTYVRSLAADLGSSLGGGAHLRNLRRLASGSFTVQQARPVNELSADRVLSPAEAMRDYPRAVVNGPTAEIVGHGGRLERSAVEAPGPGPWAVVDEAGELLAVYEAGGEEWVKPAVVTVTSQ